MFKIKSSFDKTIKIWDLDQRESVETIGKQDDVIWTAKYSHDGQHLASGLKKFLNYCLIIIFFIILFFTYIKVEKAAHLKFTALFNINKFNFLR